MLHRYFRLLRFIEILTFTKIRSSEIKTIKIISISIFLESTNGAKYRSGKCSKFIAYIIARSHSDNMSYSLRISVLGRHF